MTRDRSGRQVATTATAGSGSVRARPAPEASDGNRGRRIDSLRRRYGILLRSFLEQGREEALLDVYRLGREAVVEELGLLATTELHHTALCELVQTGVLELDESAVRRAGIVLAELLSAYEMSCRGFREASTAMRHLNEMLEDEVRRVAHAIHDGAGQYLACVHLSLYSIAKYVSDSGKPELKHAHELLEELERDLRHVSHELRPRVLENAGLVGAIEFLVDGVARRTGLEIHVDNTLSSRPAGVVETALYRCVQELLNNITKHAKAGRVDIRLREQGEFVLCEVQDDGVGFDTAELAVRGGGHQLGFLGIQERVSVLGGKVDVHSRRGHGTRVSIEIPR